MFIFIYLFWLLQVLVAAVGIFDLSCSWDLLIYCDMQDILAVACELLAVAYGMLQYGSSPPRDLTIRAPWIGSAES